MQPIEAVYIHSATRTQHTHTPACFSDARQTIEHREGGHLELEVGVLATGHLMVVDIRGRATQVRLKWSVQRPSLHEQPTQVTVLFLRHQTNMQDIPVPSWPATRGSHGLHFLCLTNGPNSLKCSVAGICVHCSGAPAPKRWIGARGREGRCRCPGKSHAARSLSRPSTAAMCILRMQTYSALAQA